MRLAFKYRICPTAPQAAFFAAQLKDACDLYNACKQQRDDAWKTCHKHINYYDQAAELKAMRADGCVTLANFSCCHDVLQRVDRTYKAFFARVKRGEETGLPEIPFRAAL
jgi:putative transposase